MSYRHFWHFYCLWRLEIWDHINTHTNKTSHSQARPVLSLELPFSESAGVDVKRAAARQGNFLRKSASRRVFFRGAGGWGRSGLGCDGACEGGGGGRQKVLRLMGERVKLMSALQRRGWVKKKEVRRRAVSRSSQRGAQVFWVEVRVS